MRNRSGFTLIELLVVVAIISILMAILLPSLGKAREQSTTLKCLSSLRSIGMANLIYAHENNGTYIPTKMDLTANTPGVRWYNNEGFTGALNLASRVNQAGYNNSYILPANMMCPKSYGILTNYSLNGYYYPPYSYGQNVTGLSSSAKYIAYRASQVNSPQQRVAFADAVDMWINYGNFTTKNWLKYVEPPSYGEMGWVDAMAAADGGNSAMTAYRHGGDSKLVNMTFFDGHAESLKFGNVKANASTIYTALGAAKDN